MEEIPGTDMTVVMDRGLEKRLARVKKREWWPVATLAEMLGKPRMYIYRRIGAGDFDVIEDGGCRKVCSESVIAFFEERQCST